MSTTITTLCLHYNFNIHIYQLKTQDKLTNITQKNRAIMTRSFYLNIFVALCDALQYLA